jgi:hypothetical protein
LLLQPLAWAAGAMVRASAARKERDRMDFMMFRVGIRERCAWAARFERGAE